MQAQIMFSRDFEPLKKLYNTIYLTPQYKYGKMTFELKLVPVIHRLYCCRYSCTLRTSTLVVGTIVLILDIIFFVCDSIELSAMKMKEDKEVEFEFDNRALTITELVFTALEMITSSMLLFGAWKERAVWLLPQLILMMCDIVILSVVIVVIFILAAIHNVLFAFIMLLIGTLLIGFFSYVWVIFYSYYRQLEERKAVPRDSMNLPDEHPTESL
ncbi:hypothetical protein L9F63_012339, partial [Diploptera punctata]